VNAYIKCYSVAISKLAYCFFAIFYCDDEWYGDAEWLVYFIPSQCLGLKFSFFLVFVIFISLFVVAYEIFRVF